MQNFQHSHLTQTVPKFRLDIYLSFKVRVNASVDANLTETKVSRNSRQNQYVQSMKMHFKVNIMLALI